MDRGQICQKMQQVVQIVLPFLSKEVYSKREKLFYGEHIIFFQSKSIFEKVCDIRKEIERPKSCRLVKWLILQSLSIPPTVNLFLISTRFSYPLLLQEARRRQQLLPLLLLQQLPLLQNQQQRLQKPLPPRQVSKMEIFTIFVVQDHFNFHI